MVQRLYKDKTAGMILDDRHEVLSIPSARVVSISWKMITIAQPILTVSLTGCLKEATLMTLYSLTRWETPCTSLKISVSFL